jgi:Tfp pilus assembly protein PilX
MVLQAHANGAALPLAMICLAVLTLLGVAGMQGSRLELLIAGNKRVHYDALAGAEFVLAAGEQAVMRLSASPFSPDNTNDPYYPPDYLDFDPSTPAVSDHPSNRHREFGHAHIPLPDLDNNGIADDGSGAYVIEDIGLLTAPGEDVSVSGTLNPLPGAYMQAFRITASSVQARGAQSLIQSIVLREPLKYQP